MKIEKAGKFLVNLHDKTEYVIHTKDLKQALNNELVFKKVYRVNKFNENAWLKPDTDKNTKTIQNLRNHIDIKLVTRERRKIYLVSEPNHHTTKFFLKKIVSYRNEKNSDMLTSKPVYLGLWILE